MVGGDISVVYDEEGVMVLMVVVLGGED